ncbi:MAG TPA: hypothetical protein VI356_13560 [Myxococcales bacterium]
MANKKWLWVAAGAVASAALVGAPRVARAYKAWELSQRQATILAAKNAIAAGADGLPELAPLINEVAAEQPAQEDGDDAEIRRLVMAAEIGPRTPDAQKYLINLAAQERAKWADAALAPSASTPGTRAWENLGPLAARSEFNGTYYKGMDSGRPTAIAVHPGNPNLTFLATSGGGVWVGDLSGNYPTWQPITDNLGALAVGSIAIDPNFDAATGRVTIWLGLGDAFDQQSGVVVKGTYTPGAAAGVWGTPVALGGTNTADGFASTPLNVRQIRIDPTNTLHMFVGTDDGFYTSVDGGLSFQLVDLPNDASTGPTRENVWEIQYLGNGATGSQWLVSGVYACPNLAGAQAGTRPPSAGAGAVACVGDANTAHFNKGDFWKSTDGGATWTSIRAAGGLPAVVTQSLGTEVGRIAFAAGATTDPTTTVLYAQAGTVQESSITGFTTATSAYMKSTDGGSTWVRIATGLTLASPATTATAVTNPTILAGEGQSGCTTMNLGHVQSWYNLTVAVDPGDSNRAIFGGDLCSARTSDGGATFQLASDWLPQSGLGFTNNGFLPYVHADWHTSLALRINGLSVLLAGTDGGIFVTRNIWDVPTPELGSWSQPDVGLATHLFYGIGTGDPTLGNPNVVFGGLQDNGTRWRLVQDENFIAEFNPGNWDQILGGDGIGAAAVSDTNGQNQVYWISVNGSRRFCIPRMWDCSQATRIQNGAEEANWRNPGAAAADPFLIRYDTLDDDSRAVASASNTSARLWFVDPVSLLASVRTVVPGPITVDGTNRTIRGMGLRVSPYRYTIDGVANTRIYGGVTTSSTTAMGSFLTYDKPGVGATTVNATHGVSIPGATGLGTGTIWIGNGSDFAAPQNPATLGGTDSKLTWLVASNSVLSNPVGSDPAVIIPPMVGHLFKTTDGGTTWTPFHGNGTGFDLPNFPVYVLRYDPTDTTDQTLWVGTEFGLYRTTDGGATWAPYDIGLPAVRVTDIRISRNGSVVRVSTYGRGIWEIHPNSEPAVANGSGDFNRSKVIDFFNMASLAARMGSTPAATNNLVYDSAVDMDGNSTIDETDLTALVAKFGSTIP